MTLASLSSAVAAVLVALALAALLAGNRRKAAAVPVRVRSGKGRS